jgi:hypothetical protein
VDVVDVFCMQNTMYANRMKPVEIVLEEEREDEG